MTTSTPIRGIKARLGSRNAAPVARRAIENPPPEPRTPRSQAAVKSETFAPEIGRPEVQLVISFLATAGIVFTFTVVLPILLSWVRNF